MCHRTTSYNIYILDKSGWGEPVKDPPIVKLNFFFFFSFQVIHSPLKLRAFSLLIFTYRQILSTHFNYFNLSTIYILRILPRQN